MHALETRVAVLHYVYSEYFLGMVPICWKFGFKKRSSDKAAQC